MIQKPANDAFFEFFRTKISDFFINFDEISLFYLPESICYDSFFFSISLSLISKVKAVSNSLISGSKY